VNSDPNNYWSDCIAQAAKKCDLELTAEQLKCLAEAAEKAHEEAAFYLPPDSN